jgi:hypothetical protein
MGNRRFHQRRGRARRALAGFAAVFILCQAGLQFVFSRRAFADPEFAHRLAFLKKKTREADGQPLTVALVGSSRFQFGLRSQQMARQLAAGTGRPVVVANFAMPGVGPIRNLITLQRLLANGVRPDLLVVELLPPLFAGNGYDELNETAVPAANRLWSDLDILERYRGDHPHLTHVRREYWRQVLVPWYSHRLGLVSQNAPFLMPFEQRLANSPMMKFPQGCIPGEVDIPAHPEKNRARAFEATQAEYFDLLHRFMLGQKQVRALRELLACCRQEAIPVALVAMPEGPRFRDWYPSPVWHAIEDMVKILAREFGISFVNARNWLDDENAFLDSHHLMAAGAAQTTGRLAHEIIGLLQRRQPLHEGGETR